MWLIFMKELLEVRRAKKELVVAFLVPTVILPLLFIGLTYLVISTAIELDSKVLNYVVVEENSAPQILQAFEEEPLFQRRDRPVEGDYKSWVGQDDIDFVLVIAAPMTGSDLVEGQVSVELYYETKRLSFVLERVEEVVESLTERLRGNEFTRLSISEKQSAALIEPIVMSTTDVVDDRESKSESAGTILAYLMVVMVFYGAMFVASDIGAGEKERGTLETILVTPVERHEIVLGKFLVIAFCGLVAALVSVVSVTFWGALLGSGSQFGGFGEFVGSVSFTDCVLMFLMLVPVVSIMGATLLSLSMYASSYKQAQSFISYLYLPLTMLCFMSVVPGVDLDGGWAWVPITNVALALKELIKGSMDYLQLLEILGSTTLLAGGMLGFCVVYCKKEEVLFRGS